MGTHLKQAQTLVATEDNPFVYTVHLDLEKLKSCKILELSDLEWACFVLFNRGYLNDFKHIQLYKLFKDSERHYDFIVGPIADDAMRRTMNEFINNNLTTIAFLECIQALNYGVQYAAKTIKACSCIEIIEKKAIYGQQKQNLEKVAEKNRLLGIQLAEKLKLEHLRDGKFFSELAQSEFSMLNFEKFSVNQQHLLELANTKRHKVKGF